MMNSKKRMLINWMSQSALASVKLVRLNNKWHVLATVPGLTLRKRNLMGSQVKLLIMKWLMRVFGLQRRCQSNSHKFRKKTSLLLACSLAAGLILSPLKPQEILPLARLELPLLHCWERCSAWSQFSEIRVNKLWVILVMSKILHGLINL